MASLARIMNREASLWPRMRKTSLACPLTVRLADTGFSSITLISNGDTIRIANILAATLCSLVLLLINRYRQDL